MTKKIAVLVDVQNIYYTTRDAFGRSFNYRALWQRLNNFGEIVMANAYAIESQLDSQRKFQDALRHIGFNVKLKPFIQRKDGSAKGDWDVGITIDALEAASSNTIDTLVLLSGDGDFDRLLQHVKQNYNVSSTVYGVESLTAQSLINAADHFESITEHLLLPK
ncbi:NYN domain-containing protein [Pleionea mediterranea]|uniref:Uncharacterized protein (TIGR00288 family) n=1 Tax=Pleionea mediterranea TaxID=523701 RepID=A0A316G108_9GAMM|nr:NYN domain-containing protein [Pleionea mediterranea]PWK54352.1 uncharacterized protein (TIGR00288 family) [Pleionea mediterranea]